MRNMATHYTDFDCVEDFWFIFPDLVQHKILSYLTDEEVYLFTKSCPCLCSQVNTIVVDVATNSDMFMEQVNDLEMYENATNLVIRCGFGNFHGRINHIMRLMAEINPKLQSMKFYDGVNRGPSGVELDTLSGNEYRVKYIKRVLELDPAYEGEKFKDTLNMDDILVLKGWYPCLCINTMVQNVFNSNDYVDEDLYSITDNSILSGFEQNEGHVDTLRTSLPNLRSLQMSSGKSVVKYRQMLSMTTLRRIIMQGSEEDLVSIFNLIHGNLLENFSFLLNKNCSRTRIIQIKNKELMIITSRYKLPPLEDVIRKFVHVKLIIFEVYQQEFQVNTEDNVQLNVDVINLVDNRKIKLIVKSD